MINDRSFSFSYERKFNLMAREENDSFQWYKRLEHLNYNGLILHSQNNMVFVPTKDKKKKNKVYEECMLLKHFRQPFPKE